MKILSREQILAASDLKHIEISVPEWGGSVRLQAMTASARDIFEQKVHRAQKDGIVPDVRATLAAMCIVGADDQPLFTLDDIAALGKKSGAAMTRIYDAVTQINALTAEEMEELEKNFGAAQSGASSSDLPNDLGNQSKN